MLTAARVAHVTRAASFLGEPAGFSNASAGRTQGSDGGIVVRAVDPANGKIAWS
jgi:hypothetical protein